MKHVRLGRSGLNVSRLCLGMMSYGDPKWRNWILSEELTPEECAALEAAYRLLQRVLPECQVLVPYHPGIAPRNS